MGTCQNKQRLIKNCLKNQDESPGNGQKNSLENYSNHQNGFIVFRSGMVRNRSNRLLKCFNSSLLMCLFLSYFLLTGLHNIFYK